jgi:hyperosmotically inducible periplasmic protein
MIRTLFRLILLVVLVVGIGAFFFGYRWGSTPDEAPHPAATTGTKPTIDTSKARQTGAEVGAAVATGANEAQRAAENGAITAKIKAKMALDDRVKAANIDVDTTGSVVTLAGRVGSDEERTRAVQLARETDGVTSVVDHLTVTRP